MPIRRIVLMLFCLTASGCAGLGVTGSLGLAGSAGDVGPSTAPPPPPGGKRLAELVNSAFATAKLTGAPEVSPVHPTHDSQWGDWVFCIKSADPAPSSRYAVLIGHDAILEVRSSVLIDGCDRETYHPLAPAAPVKAGARR